MADFSSNVQPAQTSPMPMMVAPSTSSAAGNISTFGNVASAIGTTLVQGYVQGKQMETLKSNASANVTLAQNLMRINDAEQQGSLTSAQAMRQYRLHLSQAISDNPLIQKQLTETYQSIVGAPGLGKEAVTDYSNQEANQNAIKLAEQQSALKDGFISAEMNDEQKAKGVQLHQQFLFGQTQQEQASKLLAYKTAQNNYISSGLHIQQQKQSLATGAVNQRLATLNLAKAQAQVNFMVGSQNSADAYYNVGDTNSDAIIKKVGTQVIDPNTGKPVTYTKDMAVADMQAMLSSIESHAQSVANANFEPSATNGLITPLKSLIQTKIDMLTGKISTDVANQQFNQSLALHKQLVATRDPNFMSLSASLNILGHAAPALTTPLANLAVKSLQQNGLIPQTNANGDIVPSKPADLTNGKDDNAVNQHFAVIEGALKSYYQTGGYDPSGKTKQELNTQITSILQGVDKYAKTTDSPTELNSLMQHLSNPIVGRYLNDNKELLSGVDGDKARGAIFSYYTAKVKPLIDQEFKDSTIPIGVTDINANHPIAEARFGPIPGPDNRPTTSEINIQFNGNGIVFKPVANVDSQAVQDKAKELNTTVAPVINTIIRAGAHLGGNFDYKKEYEMLNFGGAIPNDNPDAAPVKTVKDVISGS